MSAEDPMAMGLAGMAQTGNPRQPMDRSAIASIVNASATYTSGMQMHPRFSQPFTDPAFFPTARPAQTMVERGGARHAIAVGMNVPVAPEAGPTQANGRVIRGRGTGQSFWGM